MGGEGSMMHAIKSLKNNRALMKKRRSKNQRDLSTHGTNTMVEFKKVSPEELEKIKADIRAEAQKSKYKEILLTILVLAFIIALVFFAF